MRKVVGSVLLSMVSTACAPHTSRLPTVDARGPAAWTTMGSMHALPNNGRPLAKVAFPEIKDWGSLSIVLDRGVCFGNCPDYRIEIHGDGAVTFEGRNFVAVTGRHTTHIPQQAVRDLAAAFQKAEFFWLLDDYAAPITDNPDYSVQIAFDGNKKKVRDYVGRAIGMPTEVTDLEHAIDATAGSKKWIDGNSETFASLKAEGWDFRAADNQHRALIESAASQGNVSLVRDLLGEGVSAKNVYGCNGVSAAAANGSAELVDLLLSAGAPVHWNAPKGEEYQTCDALAAAMSLGVPIVVSKILAQHPEVNWQDEQGNTALIDLSNIWKRDDRADQNLGESAQLLVDAGADVNLRDNNGKSALMNSHDAAVVRVLLKAGARDVNTADWQGRTPLMNAYQSDTAQALLEGGADPWVVDKEGKTAAEILKHTYANPPAVGVIKRWMSTHPKFNQSDKP